MPRPVWQLIIVVIAFAFGFGGAWILFTSQNSSNHSSNGSEQRLGAYQFINPLLECDLGDTISNQILQSFEPKINTVIATATKDNTVSDISVYYRDLNNGPSISINASEEYFPASLLKIPLLMAILKEAGTDRSFLDKQVKYAGGDIPPSEHFSDRSIQIGKTYTIAELIEDTIRYSDNRAALLLSQILSENKIDSVYTDLGLQKPTPGKEYPIKVRDYATFFRILFNASYLDKASSDSALSLLSETDFSLGLVAGVPQGTTVSHKYGEREFADTNDRQLHDCGIVYYPGHPYLLCIMTRGTGSYEDLAKIIAKISNVVWNEVSHSLN